MPVRCVAFLFDGKIVASVACDDTIRLWGFLQEPSKGYIPIYGVEKAKLQAEIPVMSS
jgi:WD40 repeat protein